MWHSGHCKDGISTFAPLRRDMHFDLSAAEICSRHKPDLSNALPGAIASLVDCFADDRLRDICKADLSLLVTTMTNDSFRRKVAAYLESARKEGEPPGSRFALARAFASYSHQDLRVFPALLQVANHFPEHKEFFELAGRVAGCFTGEQLNLYRLTLELDALPLFVSSKRWGRDNGLEGWVKVFSGPHVHGGIVRKAIETELVARADRNEQSGHSHLMDTLDRNGLKNTLPTLERLIWRAVAPGEVTRADRAQKLLKVEVLALCITGGAVSSGAAEYGLSEYLFSKAGALSLLGPQLLTLAQSLFEPVRPITEPENEVLAARVSLANSCIDLLKEGASESGAARYLLLRIGVSSVLHPEVREHADSLFDSIRPSRS